MDIAVKDLTASVQNNGTGMMEISFQDASFGLSNQVEVLFESDFHKSAIIKCCFLLFLLLFSYYFSLLEFL